MLMFLIIFLSGLAPPNWGLWRSPLILPTREIFLKVNPESVAWQEKSFIFVPVFLVRLLGCGAHATEISMTEHPRSGGYSKMIYWRYILDIFRFSMKYRVDMMRKKRSTPSSRPKYGHQSVEPMDDDDIRDLKG